MVSTRWAAPALVLTVFLALAPSLPAAAQQAAAECSTTNKPPPTYTWRQKSSGTLYCEKQYYSTSCDVRITTVSTTNCGPKPAWAPSGTWSTCSATCGGGTQTSPAVCKSGTTTYADSFCTGTKPTALTQSCNTQACASSTYSWNTGAWSTCSATCGGGTQTRSVSCRNSSGTTVADSFCSETKPAGSQNCNTQACATTDTTPPSVPTVGPPTSTCNDVSLFWAASTDTGSGLDRYEVSRGTTRVATVAPTAPRGLVDGDVAPATTYTYTVRAFDRAGNQASDSEIAATPQCPVTGAPRLVGQVATFAGAAPAAVEIDVDETRNLAIATSLYGGVKILDIANDAAPRVVGSINLADGEADLALLPGGRAYVTQADRLVLLDLSVPSSPRAASNVYLPVAGAPLQVAVDGSRAYVSVASQLLVLDITTPATPRLLATVPLPSLATSLAVNGGYVYAASSRSTEMIDVRTPSAPITTNLFGSRSILGIAFHDGYLYWHGVSGGGGALLVFDLSRSPQFTLSLNAYYAAAALAFADRFAYTAPPSTGQVWELDMTTLLGRGGIPTTVLPPPRTRIPLGADAYALATGKAGRMIYAIDSAGAFKVIAR